MSIIEIKNLNFEYPSNGGFKLKNVTLNINKGDMAALIGPNGAGKSTLVKIMARLQKGYTGEVLINGKEAGTYSNKEAAGIISYIPQSDNYLFDFTVFEIVAMGRRPYMDSFGTLKATDMKIIHSVLEAYGLYEKRHKNYNNLSGGEKRMALIARAFVQEAQVMLMDEPTTYLDIHHQAEVMQHTLSLNKEYGKTILMVSHNINIAAEYCTRVILMKTGEIAHDGSPLEEVTNEKIKAIYGGTGYEVAVNPLTGRPNVFVKPNV